MERIPRPTGLTLQLREIRKTNSYNEKKKVLQYIITQGFILNGQNINMQQIAQLLNLPLKTIMNELSKGLKHLDILGQDLQGFYREGITLAFFGALEDRHKIKAQEEMLVRAQGGNYVPFLTAQVGQAQNNLLNSQKSLIQVLDKVGHFIKLEQEAKALGDGALPTSGTQYLSLQEALRLLEPNTLPIAQVPLALEAPKDIPNILAHGENSFALQKEALNPEYQPFEAQDQIPKKRPKHEERNEAFDAQIITADDLDEDEDIEALGTL